jgi:hypothetical protein
MVYIGIMDYRAALFQEKVRLDSLLEADITIKKIGGKHYQYRQFRENGKVRSEYIGVALPEQIGVKGRLRLVNWLIKNEDQFIDGLRLLQEMRAGPAK